MRIIKLTVITLIIGAVALGTITATRNATPPKGYEISIDGKIYQSDIFIISDKSVIFTDEQGRQIEVSIDRIEDIREVR